MAQVVANNSLTTPKVEVNPSNLEISNKVISIGKGSSDTEDNVNKKDDQTVRMVSFGIGTYAQQDETSKGTEFTRSSTLQPNLQFWGPDGLPKMRPGHRRSQSGYVSTPQARQFLSTTLKVDKCAISNRDKITQMRNKRKERKTNAHKLLSRRLTTKRRSFLVQPQAEPLRPTRSDVATQFRHLSPTVDIGADRPRSHSVGIAGKVTTNWKLGTNDDADSNPPKIHIPRTSQTERRERFYSWEESKISEYRTSKHSLNVPPLLQAELTDASSLDGVLSASEMSEYILKSSPKMSFLKKKKRDSVQYIRKILRIPAKSRKEKHLKILAEALKKLGVTFWDFDGDGDDRKQDFTMKKFCRHARSRIYPEKAKIFSQGDTSEFFYVVLSGSVVVSVKDRLTDMTKNVAVLPAGKSFGELGIIHKSLRSATIIANEPTELILVDKRDYFRIFDSKGYKSDKKQKLVTDECGTNLTQKQRIEKAAMYIDDARHQRDLTHARVDPSTIRINTLLNSSLYSVILMVIIWIQLSFVFVEPPSFADRQWESKERRNLLLLAEWAVMAFWLLDLYLRICRTSWKLFLFRTDKWFGKRNALEKKHLALIIMYSLNLIDLVSFTATYGSTIRFYRIFRPVLLIIHFQGIQQIVRITIYCTFQTKEFVLLFLIFQLIFGAVGMHLFEGLYDEEKFSRGEAPYNFLEENLCFDRTTNTTADVCNQPEWVFTSFDNFTYTYITMCVLLSTENYPWVLWPPYLISRWNVLYFISYLLFAYFFLLNILLALIFQQYELTYIYIMQEKVQSEKRALDKAWQLLDEKDILTLPISVIDKLIEKIHPDYDSKQVQMLSSLIDANGDGLIDLNEWSTLVDQLFVQIKKREANAPGGITTFIPALATSLTFVGKKVGNFATTNRSLNRSWDYMKKIDLVDYFLRMVELTDVVILLTWTGTPRYAVINTFCCGVALVRELTKVFQWNEGLIKSIKIYETSVVLDFVEMLGIIIGWSGKTYVRQIECLRFIGICRISPLCVWISRKWNQLCKQLKNTFINTKKPKDSLATLYEVEDDEKDADEQRDANLTIESLMHVMLKLSKIFALFFILMMFVCMYPWVIIGMELFNDNAQNEDRCSGYGQLANEPSARFCDVYSTFLILFQILTTNDWHEVMYNTMKVYDDWASLYFILFFFMGPVILVSLLIAYVWDFYFEELKHVQAASAKNVNYIRTFSYESDGSLSNSESILGDIDDQHKAEQNAYLSNMKTEPILSNHATDNVFEVKTVYEVQQPTTIEFMQRQIGMQKIMKGKMIEDLNRGLSHSTQTSINIRTDTEVSSKKRDTLKTLESKQLSANQHSRQVSGKRYEKISVKSKNSTKQTKQSKADLALEPSML
jgi:hypothetical protein